MKSLCYAVTIFAASAFAALVAAAAAASSAGLAGPDLQSYPSNCDQQHGVALRGSCHQPMELM